MENQQTPRWNWNIDYKPEISKWHVSFTAYTWPTPFNKEENNFNDYKTCFAWLETKLAEYNEGIDKYLSNLKKKNFQTIKSIQTEGI